MTQVLAFDVYGTLIDTAGVVTQLRAQVGERADAFARVWREKQLEYSFRRGLMQRYEDFSVCIRDALDYTCAELSTPLGSDAKAALLETYRELPPFDDVADSLAELKCSDFKIYAFSNGARATVDRLLRAAGIRESFLDIVSVEEVGSFKPDPRVYAHFLSRAGAEGSHAWLISGNSFDVLGAMAVGMRGVWVRRTERALFDPWGIEPTLTVTGLGQLGPDIAAMFAKSQI